MFRETLGWFYFQLYEIGHQCFNRKSFLIEAAAVSRFALYPGLINSFPMAREKAIGNF